MEVIVSVQSDGIRHAGADKIIVIVASPTQGQGGRRRINSPVNAALPDIETLVLLGSP